MATSGIATPESLLGHDLGLCCEPPTVLSEMRKLKVTLRGWPREMDEDDTWEDCRMLHLLCEILTDFLDLSQVSLTVALRYAKPFTWNTYERPESVLGALSLLRNLKSAKVCGIDRSYAAQLEALMMKSGRIENIWKMRRALQEWCEWWTGDRETDLDGDVPDAVYDSDIERFKLLRSDIIRGQQAENHPSVRDVFQYDLDPTQEHEALRAG
ncbi:hypothetical protein PV08_06051 [Exophiala spinifera]|uniref:Uncharacterized protein n=1 Tax=Exophiala spinifera TaxID=91928 RepID=A0A0D2BBP9_9EURO|nr:uncharacterized protein PV08_06051 [Exophiala spinifera]KIW16000.1 hypothetical protein PV08_06051 [Exophiala spinifera]